MTAIWTNTSKNSSSWSNQTQSLGVNSFLLLEDGFYLLLEDGSSKLILEQSNPAGPTYTNATKNTSAWSNQVKN